jgi:hypothetical protein
MPIGNIFIDKITYEKHSVHPVIYGVSDHDVQIITTKNITVDEPIEKTQSIRKFNKFFVSQFTINLRYEIWDVYVEDDVNTVFNKFLNTYLRIFNPCFLLHKIYSTHNNKPWITTGITTSCQHKIGLNFTSRDICSNNPKLEAYYEYYCLTLSLLMSYIYIWSSL